MEQQEECVELKNIKYKTMLLVGNPLVETKTSGDLTNIDKLYDNSLIEIINSFGSEQPLITLEVTHFIMLYRPRAWRVKSAGK